ncbi:hypothetical protein WMG39_33020, partial [Microcoleus anatoxicus PTRS2]
MRQTPFAVLSQLLTAIFAASLAHLGWLAAPTVPFLSAATAMQAVLSIAITSQSALPQVFIADLA